MTDFQNTVISLLNSALCEKKITPPEDLDYQSLYKTTEKHQITPLIYYGLINCGISPDSPHLQPFFMSTCKNITISTNQLNQLSKIFDAFDKEGIDYLPLKGTLLKHMYKKPEMRSMGDADILIKKEQYDKIKPVVNGLGFKEILESDHEFVWNKPGLLFLELHKRLIPSYNKDYYEYYGDGWKLAQLSDGSETRYQLACEDNFIYIFTHFAKHYRDAGIGIRHFLDLYVFLKANPDLDCDYLQSELSKLQLYDFYCNIKDVIAVWFEGAAPTEKTDFITDTIFQSGAYGTNDAHLLSSAVKVSNSTGSAKDVRKNRLISLIFLPYSSMCIKYPFLKKLPFLLPFMWIIRLIGAIIFKRKKIKYQNDAIQLLSEENINSYQTSLNYVGLNFSFKN